MTKFEEDRVYLQLPEHEIIKCQKLMKAQKPLEHNVYTKYLEEAEIFKEADMTPVFLLDSESDEIMVRAVETFGQRLH